jgi:hypothetical protein
MVSFTSVPFYPGETAPVPTVYSLHFQGWRTSQVRNQREGCLLLRRTGFLLDLFSNPKMKRTFSSEMSVECRRTAWRKIELFIPIVVNLKFSTWLVFNTDGVPFVWIIGNIKTDWFSNSMKKNTSWEEVVTQLVKKFLKFIERETKFHYRPRKSLGSLLSQLSSVNIITIPFLENVY